MAYFDVIAWASSPAALGFATRLYLYVSGTQ